MYRLLALDIDGTLVNSHNELTPATRAAIERASRAGIRVVLATGRRYSHALPLVESLSVRAPIVTASGALVKDPSNHATLYRAEFERATLLETLRLVDACGYDPIFCADTYAEGFDYYHACGEARTPELAGYLAMNPGRGRFCPTLLTDPPPGIFAGFATGTREQMLEVKRTLARHLGEKLHAHVLRSPRYFGFFIEITPPGVTKWSGVQRLAEQWGIRDAEICAVGDDMNDLPMIRGAGLGIAMGNAQPEVKAAAHRVAPGHDDDGLVQVIEWLLE